MKKIEFTIEELIILTTYIESDIEEIEDLIERPLLESVKIYNKHSLEIMKSIDKKIEEALLNF